MKNVLILLLLTLVGCGESSTKKEKSNMEVAETYIEDFEPQKAIPYLEKISSDEPEYAKAQELLGTMKGLNISKKMGDVPVLIDKQSLRLTNKQVKKLRGIQEQWAKQQMHEYGRYFSSYRIENPTKVIFVLGNLSSASGSIQNQEETNVPLLLSTYEDALTKNAMEGYPMQISFERKRGIKTALSTSNAGWIPSELLYEGVGVYFGQGDEKKFLGTVVRGYTENRQAYVVLKSGNHEEIKTKVFLTQNANCFLKKDDPEYQGKILRYN